MNQSFVRYWSNLSSFPRMTCLRVVFCALPFPGVRARSGGTVDAEIKVRAIEIPELTICLFLKPLVCQNIAMHTSPTATSFFLVLNSNFLTHSPSFYPYSLPIFQLPTVRQGGHSNLDASIEIPELTNLTHQNGKIRPSMLRPQP